MTIDSNIIPIAQVASSREKFASGKSSITHKKVLLEIVASSRVGLNFLGTIRSRTVAGKGKGPSCWVENNSTHGVPKSW